MDQDGLVEPFELRLAPVSPGVHICVWRCALDACHDGDRVHVTLKVDVVGVGRLGMPLRLKVCDAYNEVQSQRLRGGTRLKRLEFRYPPLRDAEDPKVQAVETKGKWVGDQFAFL